MDRQSSKKKEEVVEEKVPEGKMFIKVYAPFHDYFVGVANSLSGENDTGPFDILPGHHKFLTLLSACELTIRKDDGEEKVKIDMGVMFVKEDRVTVFLDV